MKYNFMKHLKFFVTTLISFYTIFWLFIETSDYFGTTSLKDIGWRNHLILILVICFISLIASYLYFTFIQIEKKEIQVKERFPALIDFQETFRNIDWKTLIEKSNDSIDIVVYYFDSWVNSNHESIKKFLLKPKTRIRVFVANPDDEYILENVRRLFNEYNSDTVKEKIAHTNERFLDIYKSIGADISRFEFYYHPYFLNYSLQVFDNNKAVFSIFEMYRKTKIDSPAIVINLKESNHLNDYVKKELQGVLKQSKKVL